MYSTSHVTAQATNGMYIPIILQQVDITPQAAEIIFSQGKETGNWGWKHKTWTCVTMQELMEVQAAARFYYGWSDGSEKVTAMQEGGFEYEAWYAC